MATFVETYARIQRLLESVTKFDRNSPELFQRSVRAAPYLPRKMKMLLLPRVKSDDRLLDRLTVREAPPVCQTVVQLKSWTGSTSPKQEIADLVKAMPSYAGVSWR